jgi:hypothetical protein
MRIAGTLAGAALQQFNMDYGRLDKLTLFESRDRPAPNAFLVRQHPGVTLPTHYHHTAQFQVVAEGSGTLGRHDLMPFTVHYAGQESAYGPLAAGPDGLGYFTLRPLFESGSYIMPGARAHMSPGIRRRSVTCEPMPAMSAQALTEIGASTCEPVIEPDETGLACWRLRVAPGSCVQIPLQVGGLGRFLLVTQGSLNEGGRSLPPLSVLWEGTVAGASGGDSEVSQATDHDLPLVAGPSGLELLVMQFPSNALDHKTPPAGKTVGRPVPAAA